jgi:hypothetical protein
MRLERLLLIIAGCLVVFACAFILFVIITGGQASDAQAACLAFGYPEFIMSDGIVYCTNAVEAIPLDTLGY